MDITQKHPGIGLVLACAIGLVAGCASNPTHVAGKRSHVTFDIAFQSTGGSPPTGMVIDPDGGDALLDVVSAPSPGDNKVVWASAQRFKVKFVEISDQSQPLRQRLGDEGQDWNEASKKNGKWVYELNLRQGDRADKETLGAKYFVMHSDTGVVFDPVIIVRR
jgi:hypothetical protein